MFAADQSRDATQAVGYESRRPESAMPDVASRALAARLMPLLDLTRLG